MLKRIMSNRSKKMKVFIERTVFPKNIVLCIIMLCLSVNVSGQDPVLTETIAKMNKACPIRVDDKTMLTGYKYVADEVIIEYTTSMSKKKMNALYGTQIYSQELLKAFTQNIKCKPFIKDVIDANAGIHIFYINKERDVLSICFYPEEIKREFYEAFYWEKKAAERGVANAQVNLALCFENGWGTTKDIDSAIYWYKKAVDKGNDDASLNLGTLYTYITKDYDAAIQCLEDLANKGDADAQDVLGTCYGFGKKMYQKSLYWKTKAAEQGGASHQSNLGIAYMKGYVGVIDYEKAIEWFKLAIEKGNKNAMHNLPIAQYEQAELLRQNKEYDAAFILFKQAATDLNNPIPAAMRKLAACYRYGLGTNTSLSEEQFWMEEAVKYNDEIAMKIMGDNV